MRGFLVLRDSPYMAKTNSRGEFEINYLPEGEHTFRLWHERFGFIKSISGDKAGTNNRGRMTIQIRRNVDTEFVLPIPIENIPLPKD